VLRIRYAGQHRQQRDVVGGVEKRNQVRRLEHKPDPITTQRAQIPGFPRVVENHLAAEGEFAGGRFDHRAEAFQQRGLAGA